MNRQYEWPGKKTNVFFFFFFLYNNGKMTNFASEMNETTVVSTEVRHLDY